MEEENHEEDVSYEVNYMYLRFVLMSALIFSGYYYIHTRIIKLQEERKDRFEGRVSVDQNHSKKSMSTSINNF